MQGYQWPIGLGMTLALVSVVCMSGTLARAASCKNQLQAVVVGKASESRLDWIDPDTPDDQCVKTLCRGDYGSCHPETAQSPKTDMYLVFSDEFKKEGRSFSAAANDTKWTAIDLYYYPTKDEQVYKPEQVKTEDGNLVITVERRTASAITPQPKGEKLSFTKNFVSGMVQGFNKFCYTGGYLEASVHLPGNEREPGLWPGFWTMGNLGRAGYMQSTGGMWPYSYNGCSDASGQTWAENDVQTLSACGDQAGIDRERDYGMEPGVGRGAPEFDVFEISVPGGGDPAHASQTLQMAPLLPPGTSWTDKNSKGGLFYPGEKVQPFDTRPNPWQGEFGRPGNMLQDSISALTDLNSSFFTEFHTFGVDWKPGEYLRWYIDDVFLYEVNKEALIPRKNASGAEVGERLIPLEPVYIIMNLAMSNDFNKQYIDYNNLNIGFPQQMKVAWVRVYQDPKDYNVGCSPKTFPTAQYIACNREKYTAVDCDGVMITEECKTKDVPIEECSEYNSKGGELATMVGTVALAFLAIGLLG